MPTYRQVPCKDLSPGNIVRSGKEGYVIKDIEVEGRNLVISFVGTQETLTTSPDSKAYVEEVDPFIDINLEPSEVTAAAWEAVSEWDWESDFDTP